MSEDFGAGFWDARYRERDAVWSGEPNPQLVAEVAGLPPGSALDVGSGEGADAIWLASRGWTVTAVDFSAEALARAAARDAPADRITWEQQDVTAWQPPAAAFDLVSAQFMHLPPEQRLPLHRRLASAVAPGGLLLIVGHDPSDLGSTVRRPSRPHVLFTAEEAAAAVSGPDWETLACEARPRLQSDAEGQPVQVHDAVLVARRRS